MMMNQTQTIWTLYAFFLILLGLLTYYLWKHKDQFSQTMNALSSKIRPAVKESIRLLKNKGYQFKPCYEGKNVIQYEVLSPE